MNSSRYLNFFRAWRYLPLRLALIWLVVIPTLPHAIAQDSRQSKPRPLDPLTKEERTLAARVAREADATQKALGQGRQRLISVELATPKFTGSSPSDEALTGRWAEVIFYRYDTNQGIRALVKLEPLALHSVTRFDGRAAPLAVEEVSEAFNLALKNQQLLNLLGAEAQLYKVFERAPSDEQSFRVEGLRLISPSKKAACYRHRCVLLNFRRGQVYLRDFSVVADLTTEKVQIETRRR